MGTFLLLMVEAGAVGGELTEAAGEGGFGLNTDILETNLINLAIIISVLFIFGRRVLGNTLQERRERRATRQRCSSSLSRAATKAGASSSRG